MTEHREQDWSSEDGTSQHPAVYPRTPVEESFNDTEWRCAMLEKENKCLRQSLALVEAKLDILENEKELHIQTHANDRAVWEFEKSTLLSELKQTRRQCKAEYERALELVNEVKDTVASLHLVNEPGHRTPTKLSDKHFSPRSHFNSRFSNPRHSQKTSFSHKTIKREGFKHPQGLEPKFSQLERVLSQLERKQRKLRSCLQTIALDATPHKTCR